MDIQQINQFISGMNDENEIHALLGRSDVHEVTNNGKVEGLALTWKNSIHPHCTYIKFVIPQDAHLDTGQQLLLKVKTDHPLQTLVPAEDERLKEFLEQVGFSVIRRTYIAQLETDKLHKTLENIIPLSEIGKQKDSLIALVKQNYEATHKANPVADLSHDQWEKLIFADDLVMEGSFFSKDPVNEDIIAYSFLHESESENVMELGWCGGDPTILREIIRMQVGIAKEKGTEWLEGEFDSTDDAAMSVFKELPFHVQDTLITYRKH